MGTKIDPGGSKIDPGGSKSTPERPRSGRKRRQAAKKCTESSPRASRERFLRPLRFFGCQKGSQKGQKGRFFPLKIAPKGGPGAETAIFFAKMRKCSKHRVARVQMALRTIQNRQKSVEEGEKWRRNQRKCKTKTLAEKNETERQKRGPKVEFYEFW